VITLEEANLLLRPFGPTDFIRQATAVELAQLNLNEGIMVQFSVYDDGQAAFQVGQSSSNLLQTFHSLCSGLP